MKIAFIIEISKPTIFLFKNFDEITNIIIYAHFNITKQFEGRYRATENHHLIARGQSKQSFIYPFGRAGIVTNQRTRQPLSGAYNIFTQSRQ